ncbi:hypothetical protein [Lentzea sp. NPDC004782]|uniref:hypothetical protein n=1 Tax=Lentzea sp. NPDC004782 TaxID=3154458 RepID=UPI0033BF443F
MPRGETTPGLEPGDRAEVRVAQAWFWDGYYVRRGVDLQHRYGRDALSVTDLDLLGYLISPALTAQKYIGEVKTGKSSSTPRPLDRALWVRGLRELVKAEGAEVTTAFRASADVRGFTRTFGVTIQHLDDLEARERRLYVDDIVDCGSQGDTIALLIKQVHKQLKGDADLERAFWFLRSEVWFLDPFDAIKRNIGLLRELRPRWSDGLDTGSLQALRWLYAESISVLGLQLALIAGVAVTMDVSSFRELALARLSVGDIPLSAMTRISDRVDRYVSELLKHFDAPVDVRMEALGAVMPAAPEYAEPLLELVQRLATQVGATSRLPRQLDLLIFERLARARSIRSDAARRLGFGPATERLVKLVAAFLRGQVGLPPAVDHALTASLFSTRGTPVDQQALFEPEPEHADEHQANQAKP